MRRALPWAPLLLSLLLAAPPARAGEGSIDFTVRDLKGQYLRLSDYQDKVVEIAFWATYCKVCLKKLKYLDRWYRKHGPRGFVVLGVSVDGPETQAKVQGVVRTHKLSFPVVIDKESRISRLFNPKRATPFSVILKRGKKVVVREGFQLSEAEMMERELVRLLP